MYLPYHNGRSKKALDALCVQIVAIPGEMKIRIAVPLEFTTIEQTSAYNWAHVKHVVPQIKVV